MSLRWLQQRERGYGWLYRFFFWTALRLGRSTARALSYPICTYMVLFPQASKAIEKYLTKVLERPARPRDLFRQYYYFATTVIDRGFLVSSRFDEFELTAYGYEPVIERAQRGQGCLLLGSHLGSFEIVRACGHKYFNQVGELPVSILMHDETTPALRKELARLNPEIDKAIIPVGSPDSMLTVKERLDRGEFVGILGDRPVKDEKVVSCRFFGDSIKLPAGPMLLASILKVPVILFFGLYRGGRHYEVHLELFAEQVTVDRKNREHDIQEWTQRYVDRVEHYCKIAPYNWFNFYDYWGHES